MAAPYSAEERYLAVVDSGWLAGGRELGGLVASVHEPRPAQLWWDSVTDVEREQEARCRRWRLQAKGNAHRRNKCRNHHVPCQAPNHNLLYSRS